VCICNSIYYVFLLVECNIVFYCSLSISFIGLFLILVYSAALRSGASTVCSCASSNGAAVAVFVFKSATYQIAAAHLGGIHALVPVVAAFDPFFALAFALEAGAAGDQVVFVVDAFRHHKHAWEALPNVCDSVALLLREFVPAQLLGFDSPQAFEVAVAAGTLLVE